MSLPVSHLINTVCGSHGVARFRVGPKLEIRPPRGPGQAWPKYRQMSSPLHHTIYIGVAGIISCHGGKFTFAAADVGFLPDVNWVLFHRLHIKNLLTQPKTQKQAMNDQYNAGYDPAKLCNSIRDDA